MDGMGKRLKELIKERNITQVELSARCGLSRKCISHMICSDNKRPDIETVRMIAEALGVTVGYLLHGD